ncbi:maleylpyruvate isomerase family mycothiol-dependent enzyme [Catelliglobosispora koreensis]|uniref:maleylpyruvate isomerase family mycothiol-dependent enzyme n=1 Tax=Catelliglobosispora koreensis TaxID=129052 RepID=UPI00037E6B3C|nr:maleylpyruvate isomerase family mycothiol-dependent enzyme [Catelliglobosispora koreensis]
MDHTEHIAFLRTEGMLLADAAEAAGFDTTVPTCPEWTVRDLVRHAGRVHRWARRHVDEQLTSVAQSEATWPEADADLLEWFREGHALLLATLETADPELECFTFLPSGLSGTRFWARRQAHETAIHRVDAQLASGAGASPATSDFAVDGIDEILHGFFARRPSKLTSPELVSFTLVSTDTTNAWTVNIDETGASTVDGPGTASDGRVYGPAFDLYLLLWNRRSLAGLETQGSVEGLSHWRDHARVTFR